jgi:hypothetical protein
VSSFTTSTFIVFGEKYHCGWYVLTGSPGLAHFTSNGLALCGLPPLPQGVMMVRCPDEPRHIQRCEACAELKDGFISAMEEKQRKDLPPNEVSDETWTATLDSEGGA